MTTTRRDLLRASAGLAAGAAAVPVFGTQSSPERKLRLLVLGGTGFLGPHTVRAALERGHAVTLFNRGRTNPELFADLEQLRGDRNGDLGALEGREWDAVIDVHAHLPEWVRLAADLLKDAVGQYVFVSTISVYPGFPTEDVDETSAVARLPEGSDESFTMQKYGALKVLCEEAAEERLPGRVAVARPGLIVGPGDYTDRFTYWPVRIAAGGEVLAPNRPEDPVQYVDARDLGAWIVRAAEDRTTGTFNAVGPEEPLPVGDLLEACLAAGEAEAELTWVDAAWLAEQGVRGFMDLPVWLPPNAETGRPGLVANARAVEAGMTFRPVLETVRDTLAWRRESLAERPLAWGIAREREAEVLAAWHARENG